MHYFCNTATRLFFLLSLSASSLVSRRSRGCLTRLCFLLSLSTASVVSRCSGNTATHLFLLSASSFYSFSIKSGFVLLSWLLDMPSFFTISISRKPGFSLSTASLYSLFADIYKFGFVFARKSLYLLTYNNKSNFSCSLMHNSPSPL